MKAMKEIHIQLVVTMLTNALLASTAMSMLVAQIFQDHLHALVTLVIMEILTAVTTSIRIFLINVRPQINCYFAESIQWRDDGACGSGNNILDGSEGTCNPNGDHCCCSSS